MPTPRANLVAALSVSLFLVSACSRSPSDPSDPSVQPPVPPPSLEIRDGAHLGNGHFFFLPPMVPMPAYSGASNPDAAPVIVVCEWTSAQCGAVVATFSMTTGTGGNRIRYHRVHTDDAAAEDTPVEDGHYHTNWDTDVCNSGPCALNGQKTYRVRVLVGAVEVGHADLDVVENTTQLKNVNTNEYIPLKNGKTLKIRFRIEDEAVSVAPASGTVSVGGTGGSVTNAAGNVALLVPAGALGGNTPISIATVASPPAGAGPWAPVVDLGPNGQTFAYPVTLSIGYNPEVLPAGISPTALAPAYFDGTGWEILPNAVTNEADNTITVPISHFSVYSVVIRPTVVQGVPAPTSIPIGGTTSLTATGWAYQVVPSTYCYYTYSWFSRRLVCVNYTSTYYYPAANLRAVWGSQQPQVASVAVATTYTDLNGTSVSPAITGVFPGAAPIFSQIGGLTSSTVVTVLGQLSLAPKTQTIVAGWSIGRTVSRGVTQIVSLAVSLTNKNGSLVVFEPGASNQTTGGATGTYVIAAGSATKQLGIAGLAGVGIDTLIASAPGFLPDTAIVTVERGAFQVSGWRDTLAFGDSAAVQLTVASQTGGQGGLAVPIAVGLRGSAHLAFSNGTAAITTLGIQQRTSPTFYVKAVAGGAAQLILTHPDYLPDTLRTTVTNLPKLVFSVFASGTAPLRRFGLNQGTGLVTTIPGALPTPLTVSFGHSDPAVTQSNPTATIASGNVSEGVTLIARTKVGIDTLIGTAPGYAPDTLVVETGLGRTFLENWPTTIPFGDSVAVRIRPMNQDSSIIDNAWGTSFALASDGKLAFSRANAAITGITIPDGTSASPTFYVKAVGIGAASLTATNSWYTTSPYPVTVTPPPVPPAINPTPQGRTQFLLQLLPGTTASGAVPISNAGGSTLTGLQVVGIPANCYTGQQLPWLTFSFASQTAPTTLTITATVPAGTAYGVYDLCFTLRGTGAADYSYGTRVSVQEVVIPNGPFINPFPQGPTQHSITVRAGESGSRDVPVSNGGGGTLSGLTFVGPVRNCNTGQMIPWLTGTWAATTAPTTLTLTATPPASVPAGTQDLCFELQARAAGAMDYAYGVRLNIQSSLTVSMADLGTLGGSGTSVAQSLNASGRVVGYSNGVAVTWPSLTSALTSIPNPYGDLDYALDVNTAGLISGLTPYVGWIYDPGAGTFKTAPGAFPVTNRSWSFGLNDVGQAVACSDNGSFAQNYVWTVATNQTALIANAYNWCDGRINNAGMAIVSADPGAGGAARLYNTSSGAVTVLPTFGGATVGRDINASNIVVGSSKNAAGKVRAFRYDPATGAMLDLGTLGGLEAEAFGINDQGWIVGWSLTAAGERHAFARNPVSGWMYDLGVQGGFDQSSAADINPDGDIVGWSSVGNPGGLGGMGRTIGVITGTTRATRWSIR